MDADIKHTIDLLKHNIPRNFNKIACTEKNTKILEKWIDMLQDGVRSREYQTVHYQKHRIHSVVDPELNYSPKIIQDYLKNTSWHAYSFSFQIGMRHIHVQFHTPILEKKTYDERKIKKCFERVYLWFYFITKFAPKKCSTEFTVKLYFTDHKKHAVRKLEPLDQIHVNTAFTTSCKPTTSIYIYREEEWFKVLMHESFHNLGLDFSSLDERYSNAKMLAIFPITSHNGIRIYESYCETWATLLNCLFDSFFSTHDKMNTPKILEKMYAMLELECSFSLVQCAKILKHYGMTYRELISAKNDTRKISAKFVEKSHVLSYYIVKSIFLCHIEDFLTWCRTHNQNVLCFNKTYETVDSYIELIIKLYKHPTFLEKTDYIQENVIDKFQDNTLRMTLFG